jgi:hypothetical protein
MGKWRYSSTILDLGTRWRLAVRFTPQLHYSQGNFIGGWVDPRANLDIVKRKLLPLLGFEPQ